jgi:hypothetical protein
METLLCYSFRFSVLCVITRPLVNDVTCTFFSLWGRLMQFILYRKFGKGYEKIASDLYFPHTLKDITYEKPDYFFFAFLVFAMSQKMPFFSELLLILNHFLTLMLISFIIHSLELKSERLECVIWTMGSRTEVEKESLSPTSENINNNATQISLRFLNVY